MAIHKFFTGDHNQQQQTDLGADYPDWVWNPAYAHMTAEIIRITPELAKVWLGRNTDNRRLRKHRANVLAKEMTDGNWAANGESISFDTKGALVDGQHRLQAIINSGVISPLTPIIMGIEPGVRSTVDTGLKRSAADVLGMRGERYAATLAGTIQLWAAYYLGDFRRTGTFKAKLSHIEVLKWLDDWPSIRDSVGAAASLASGQRYCLAPAEACFLHHAITQGGTSFEVAEEFLTSVLRGANLQEHSPVLALRRRLLDESRPGRSPMDKRTKLALVLKAFEFWSKGQSRKVLRFHADEEFPDLGIGGRQPNVTA